MQIRDTYKISYIFGFESDLEGGELIELYNLEEDPEEMDNLASSRPDIVTDMLAEIKPQLARTS
jgi:hypothetical protein